MNHDKNIGLIECGLTDSCFAKTPAHLPPHFQIKKAFAFHEGSRKVLQKRFPHLEWASDCNAILEDENIGLVLISAPDAGHRRLIGAALKANKHVQIV